MMMACRAYSQQPWQNASLPFVTRVHNLISLLNMSEKVLLLEVSTPALPRIGLPSFSHKECERGDSDGTAFPSGAAMAATWDPELIETVARSIALEARSFSNLGHSDTVCYGPVVNFIHDARWGRTNEMLGGEDTTLGAVLGSAFVRGMQSWRAPTRAGEEYFAALSIVKHLNVYSGPEGDGFTFGPRALRFSFNVNLPSTRAEREFFLPIFHATAIAGASGFMCSYSAVSGALNQSNVPACASRELLTNVIREEWGWNGLVLSDAGAVAFIGNVSIGGVPFGHHFTSSDEESAIAAITAGMDLELTCCGAPQVFPTLPGAVAAGRLAESVLDTALARSLSTRFKLGKLDDPALLPFSTWGNRLRCFNSQRKLQ